MASTGTPARAWPRHRACPWHRQQAASPSPGPAGAAGTVTLAQGAVPALPHSSDQHRPGPARCPLLVLAAAAAQSCLNPTSPGLAAATAAPDHREGQELHCPCPWQPRWYWIRGTETAATEIPNSLPSPPPNPVLPPHIPIFLFSHSTEFLAPEHQEPSPAPAQPLQLHPAQLPAIRTTLQPQCCSLTISPNSCRSGHQGMAFSDSCPRPDSPSVSSER